MNTYKGTLTYEAVARGAGPGVDMGTLGWLSGSRVARPISDSVATVDGLTAERRDLAASVDDDEYTAAWQGLEIWVLGASGLVIFALFATLNAWDPKVLKPATTGQIFVYTALSAVTFLVFVGVLLMLVRNVLKLYADQKSRVMGSRLRTRMRWARCW